MKFLKNVAAFILIACMILTAAACHSKDEIAVKVGNVKFTSAYYMCALIYADGQARTKVDEKYQGDVDKAAEGIDYFSEKIDSKDYVDWVKDTALDSLRETASYKIKCEENKLTLTDEQQEYAAQAASYYWTSYKYSEYFEPNGVSEATFNEYMKDSYYKERYFEFVYGKDGEKAIAAADLTKALNTDYQIADIIDLTYADLEEAESEKKKAFLTSAVDQLKNGSKTFTQILNEYNGSTEDTTQQTTDDPAPKDKNAQIIGNSDSGYSTYADYYDKIKALKTGEVSLITKDSDAGLLLVVKGDITSDSYYLTALDSELRHYIKDDEFDDDMKAYSGTLKIEETKSATKQFKVKKIVYPETSSTAQ